MTRLPEKNDSELASKIGMSSSTFTSVKKRLESNGYFNFFYVPMLNRLDCEFLGVVFTDFNSVIPLKKRVNIVKDKIESFEEIFFSIGALEKGFSLSFNQNYTKFNRINEVRTKTFGKHKLIEKEYPHEMIFPFETSNIVRFFDYGRLLKNQFDFKTFENRVIKFEKKNKVNKNKMNWFSNNSRYNMNNKEKKVFIELMRNPDETMENIGKIVGFSRHTVSRMKKKFLNENLLAGKIQVDLSKIGLNILVFYNLKFNPQKPITKEIINMLDSPTTLFFVQNEFKAVIISVYSSYSEYKQDKMVKFTNLKGHKILTYIPKPKKYVFNQSEIIKNLEFVPITKKIFKI